MTGTGMVRCDENGWNFWRQKRDAFKEMHLIPTVKFGGGSLMLWGCFAASGPEALVKINGIMNSTKYQDILAQSNGCLCQEAETWP